MKIGTRTLTTGKPFIIAEIGVNHDGDPARALALTRLAAASGADAVKFQHFRAEMLMSGASRLAAYQAAAGERDPLSMLRRLELSCESLAACVDLAHELGVLAMVSVFSVELVAESADIPWDAFKTASPDIIHRPLLEALARTGRPLVVSTGASTIEEIARAVEWLAPWRTNLALLQCVSSYPTPPADAELGGIPSLRAEFPGIPIGYSDHTSLVETGALAAALGAQILEKHFTDNTAAPGPDHAASLDGAGFAEYCRAARAGTAAVVEVEPVKRVLAIERDVRTVSRQSIVAREPVRRGTLLSSADLTFKRPGTGLAPFEVERVVGRAAARDIEPDTPLTADDVQWR
ncbi:MAG: N-acetylneuraminate synthase family protein [Phycisphaerales bacterium]